MKKLWLLLLLSISLCPYVSAQSLPEPSQHRKDFPFPGAFPENARRDSLDVRMVGRWSYGPSYAVAIDGNVTYLGSGHGVYVLESMSSIHQFQTRDAVYDLVFDDNYLYVANGGAV
jgi:hypothetical protein